MVRITSLVLLGSLLAACGGDDSSTSDPANTVAFDLTGGDELFAMPYPSDLRLKDDHTIDLATFPNPRQLPIVKDLLSSAAEHHGFPVMPIAYFRFTGEAPAHDIASVISADVGQDALLLDIDATSPEKGALYPLVAYTLPKDGFTGEGLVAVAPRPGAVLRPGTTYAFVLKKAFAAGVTPPTAFEELATGGGDEKAKALYAPLWPELDEIGVAKKDVLVATVFTTGDAVRDMQTLSDLVRLHRTPTVDNLAIDTEHGVNHPDVCVLAGTITYPQFQKGVQPFSTEGRFDINPELGPVQQGEMTVPVRITIPKGVMPSSGWPLWQYVHGSGGASFDIVDEGYNTTADSGAMAGEGPGVVVGRRGIATAASAMPVNPERLVGADAQAYLNFNNLAALPYTFQQGVFEQRLFLDALLALQVTPAMLNGCGATLPAGHTFGTFDSEHVMLGGHSMGGMYTNMIGAVERRFQILTPFGAGGFWNLMILDTEVVANGRELLAGILGVDGETLTFTHPVLAMLGTGWEVAEPGASMARIARRPLENTKARSVYEPVGLDDRYFPNAVYDAAALAYGNNESGEIVWPGTQDALKTEGLGGILSYPVKQNRTNADGKTTSVVVQYSDGGLVDAHQIYRQLPEVRFQYSCFLASYLRDGVPTVFAPAGSNRSDENAPCPAAP
ncbi:MAG TPA: hypothetical protein VGM90_17295 [Kofleriaceae bacterium]